MVSPFSAKPFKSAKFALGSYPSPHNRCELSRQVCPEGRTSPRITIEEGELKANRNNLRRRHQIRSHWACRVALYISNTEPKDRQSNFNAIKIKANKIKWKDF